MKRIFISFISIVMLVGANAQSQYGTWTSFSVDKKLNKKWNIEAETELRTINYVRSINRWSVGLNVNYKVFKPVELGLSYQLMHVFDEKYKNYQFRNRVNGDITGKQKIGNLQFELAEGVQFTTKDDSKRIKKDGTINTYAINPAWMWKNALQVEYNFPKNKLTPGFEFKTYYSLNNPEGNAFDKLRYTLFLKYKINKHNSIKVFGLINNELGTDEADYSGKYIVGVSYSLHL